MENPTTRWPEWREDLFDPRKVPFSIGGSFLAISYLREDESYWIRNVRGGDEETDLGRLLRFTPIDKNGNPVQFTVQLAPDCLTFFASDGGYARLAFDGPDRICVSARSLSMRFEAGASKYNYAQEGERGINLCIARQDLRCDAAAQGAGLRLEAPWNGLAANFITIDVTPESEAAQASFEFYKVAPSGTNGRSFESARATSELEFRSFLDRTLTSPEYLAAGRLLAAYVTWSAYVQAEGALAVPAMYMSKNWMTNIWSWDHCFNALALGYLQPAAAFDQMVVIFAHQHVCGRLPDYVNDRYAYWSFTKPPVHGWTFSKLRKLAPDFYNHERMSTVVKWLESQVKSWMSGSSRDGLPAYRHGNDAGWDNATMFMDGGPVISPDLATFIILQLDEIAELYDALGNTDASCDARARSAQIEAALYTSLWCDDGFVARLQASGKMVQGGDCLITFIPLLLGKRLPENYRTALLNKLLHNERYLTAHGFATEGTGSPYYQPDGYWRGPIWAPTTALLVDALVCCGLEDVGQDIARRFCTMANRSGMAENFNALTGEGQCDPAFTWTSSVFLLMGNKLLDALLSPA